MKARGLFPPFVKRVASDWRARFPQVARVARTYCPAMPKTSTFYAGADNKYGRHLYLHFQHNSKAWGVGDFTVNVIFSAHEGVPGRWLGPADLELEPQPEGSYRLGLLVHGRDKWWRLGAGEALYPTTWHATSYARVETVFDEALEDVSRDVDTLFTQIQQWRSGRPDS